MIEFTQDGTHFKVKPENAMKYRNLMKKPTMHKFVGLSSKNTRVYPLFRAGMTTAEYVDEFQSQFQGNGHVRLIPVVHNCANYHNKAPTLDPTTDEVVEELDPEYMPTARTTSPKKQTVSVLRKSMRVAIELLKSGDSIGALFVLTEGVTE